MVKFTVRMHADLTFLKRELETDEPLPPAATAALERFIECFDRSAMGVAARARGKVAEVDREELRKAFGEVVQALRDGYPHSEGARLMLQRLLEDLSSLNRSIERALELGNAA
jgi:hypothetical protein